MHSLNSVLYNFFLIIVSHTEEMKMNIYLYMPPKRAIIRNKTEVR